MGRMMRICWIVNRAELLLRDPACAPSHNARAIRTPGWPSDSEAQGIRQLEGPLLADWKGDDFGQSMQQSWASENINPS